MQPKTFEERLDKVQADIAALPADSDTVKSVVKRRRRLVDELMLLQVEIANVADCLEAQRAECETSERLTKLPHVSPNVLRDRIARKPSNRFYNVQKAFSLPQDYRVLPDGPTPFSWESEAILKSVIHPEKLPTELLEELGFPMPQGKNGKPAPYAEIVKAKIATIPRLKETFANAFPVGSTSTGRSKAFAIVDEEPSLSGKIVAFQDFSSRESKRQNSLLTVAKAYPDAFSYLRSRYYAQNFLSERERSLQESANSLSKLIVEYDASETDGSSLDEIRGILASRKTFFEQRAYLDRLLSVKLRNRSQDRLRIKGALSDVQKGFLERMGKRLAMESQAKTLETFIERENVTWKAVYRRITPLLEGMPETASKRALDITTVLKSYALTGMDFPVRPFSGIRTTFELARKRLYECLPNPDPKDCLSAISHVDRLMRAQAFWLFCIGLEHAFKTDSVMEGSADSEKLSTVVERRIARIESMVFSGLDTEAAVSPRFTKYAELIKEFRALAETCDYDGLVRRLKDIRKQT